MSGSPHHEWLEADGLGGFASGCVDQVRRRRYHALLLAATRPPAGRMVLVSGFDAWVDTEAGRFAISAQRYAPDAVSPDGDRRVEAFSSEPWPRWTFRLDPGVTVEQELLVTHERPLCVLRWRLRGASGPARLTLRPFLSGRDHHALHHENGAFRFEAEVAEGRVTWRPYEGVPAVTVLHSGRYQHEPYWYRRFLYEEEQARGLDCEEDLAAPGVIVLDLAPEAHCVLATAEAAAALSGPLGDAVECLREGERRRRAALAAPLLRAADAYLVRRGQGRSIVAGYPWFTDWGRDTFIALRGLCLATGRLAEARDILLEWAGTVSEGMLPNCFPDQGDAPAYNAVDASLWFVVAVHELREAAGPAVVDAAARLRLQAAVLAILGGYTTGTRHGIRADADGLLAAGEDGQQLTWMDARVDGRVITPRMGKPVEIQALWINALEAAARFAPRFAAAAARARTAFAERFWNEAARGLYDVVDVDHVAGTVDSTLRPNQILAVGGLPFAVLEGERARAVVDLVEARLLTPLGLRTLPQDDPHYAGRYEGGPAERDAVYHQGTVWPWLMGPFVEAWVRVRGVSEAVRTEARHRFLDPLLAHLDEAGLGHVSEIADGDAPHVARGCPFQAWSVGEALRLTRLLQPAAGPAAAGAASAMGERA